MRNNFKPKPVIRHPMVQTVLTSLKVRPPVNSMTRSAERIILPGGRGERLLALHSRSESNTKGTVLLIHGWEGSSDSTYIINTGGFLFDHGYDVIRLNLRDHGDSHALNRGLFKSTLIEETFGAVEKAARLTGRAPFFVAGFSLGGNFALRIALQAGKKKIPNLKRVVAVSPVLDPLKAMKATDRNFIIRKYFLLKWTRSLEKKKALFPDLYDFSDIRRYDTIVGLTGAFVPKYTEFATPEEYYSRYTMTNGALDKLKVPVSIITSEDDPIIPVDDFYGLKPHRNLDVTILPYGGHCGFFDLFPRRVWYHGRLLELFRD
jgi:predicted alpha/beta-fold hydrolase